MSKSEYDQLVRLSQDVKYQNAIAQLFQLSTISESPQLLQFGKVLAALTITCFLLSAMVWWWLLRDPPTAYGNRTPSVTSANGSVESEHAAHDLHSRRLDPWAEPVAANRRPNH
jgi:hypothetical protein